MVVRRRLLAALSGVALPAAMAVALGPGQAAAQSSVSFTSSPTVANIVTHYTVSHTGASSAAASASTEESRLAVKWPKGHGAASVKNATGGVNANSSGSSATSTSTPGTTSSFIGQQGSSTTCSYFAHGCNPPDMALGASSQFVLQGVNTQWEVTDTAGNVQPGWPMSAQNFFGVPSETGNCDPGSNNQPFLSDPRALYDPAAGRFWAAMLQIEGAQAFGVALNCPYKSVYYVAVSATSDPRGSWNVYEFNMETDVPNADGTIQKFGADYTQLGINGQAVYFSANMFGENGGFFAELFEANKAQMEKGQAHFTADGFFNLQGTGPGSSVHGPFLADTVQPTMNLDNSTGTSETFISTMDGPDVMTGHLCGVLGGGFSDACSGAVVWTMANPTAHDKSGPAPTLSAVLVPTAPFLISVPADQPSCNVCIDVLDLRLTGTPVVRNGTAYGAWETAIGAGNQPRPTPGIEWAEINLATSTATTNYFSFTAHEAASFGTLMPDAQGNLTMLYEHMGPNVFPETRYIVKGAGDANFSGPGNLLKAGESSYRPTLCGTAAIPVCRWGDFEAASFDGSGHIWFAGEYANQFQGVATPPAFGRNWGTWIGAIAAS